MNRTSMTVRPHQVVKIHSIRVSEDKEVGKGEQKKIFEGVTAKICPHLMEINYSPKNLDKPQAEEKESKPF